MQFRHKNSLVRHLCQHSGERPHKCQQCAAAFVSMCRLKEHNKRYHKKMRGNRTSDDKSCDSHNTINKCSSQSTDNKTVSCPPVHVNMTTKTIQTLQAVNKISKPSTQDVSLPLITHVPVIINIPLLTYCQNVS